MKRIIIIIVFLIASLSVFSQDGLGLRAGVNLEKKFTKKLTVDFLAQARFNNNISYLQTYLFELGAGYKLPYGFDISAYYRFANRKKDETKEFKNRHRYYADLGYGKKFGGIKLENRLRYQHQFKDNDGVTEFDASYIRDKIEVSFPSKSKFTPYLSNDFFIEVGGKLDQLRPKVGVNYKHNKKSSVDFSVFNDIDLIGGETYSPVLGLTYKFRL